jgi:hypothetical protein
MPAPNGIENFWAQVDKSGSCWIWTGTYPGSDRGPRYGRFGFMGKKHAAHRFSWQIANGKIPSGMHVLHRCDNPNCVRPDHLFLGTHRDNMLDMFAKGRRRILRGSEQGLAKLCEQDILLIRRKYSAGARQIDLAKEFNVDQTSISRIVLYKSWKHVKGDASAA